MYKALLLLTTWLMPPGEMTILLGNEAGLNAHQNSIEITLYHTLIGNPKLE
jgi:hypothetical protein